MLDLSRDHTALEQRGTGTCNKSEKWPNLGYSVDFPRDQKGVWVLVWIENFLSGRYLFFASGQISKGELLCGMNGKARH